MAKDKLSKSQPDLPLPEKEISEYATPASQGLALRSYGPKWIKLGIVAVVLLVLLGGVYMLGKNSQSNSASQTPTQEMSPSPTHLPANASTANWKTYINPEYGYTFKYPLHSGVTIDKDMDQSLIYSSIIVSSESSYGSIYIQVKENNSDLNIHDWWEKNSENYCTNNIYKDITIDGYPGIVFDNPKSQIQKCAEGKMVFIAKDKNIFSLFPTVTSESDKSMFDQILSTFRFE